MPHFVSIAPFLNSERGHFHPYHVWLQEAAAQNGWTFSALISKIHSLSAVPDCWLPRLRCESGLNRPRFLKHAHAKWIYRQSLRSSLVTQFAKGEDCLIFAEYFSKRQLCALIRVLEKIHKETIYVCLMFRSTAQNTKENLQPYFSLLHELRSLLPIGHLSLISDNQAKIEELSSWFGQPFYSLPVIAGLPDLPSLRSSADGLRCWLPGQMKRNKGREILIELASRVDAEASSITLLLPATLQLSQRKGAPKQERIAAAPNRKEYIALLQSADTILLPYDAEHYATQTSGVFVEAVTAGKLPLVTRGTWMASELSRHDLSELSIEWSRPNVYAYVHACFHNASLRQRLERMQKHYQQLHSSQHLAHCLRKAFNH